MTVDSRKKLSYILDKSSLRVSGDFLPEDPLRLSLNAIAFAKKFFLRLETTPFFPKAWSPESTQSA